MKAALEHFGTGWVGKRAAFIAALLLAAMLPTGAMGQTPPAAKDPNHRCMQCHGQKHIAELNPTERRSMVGTWLDTSDPATRPSPPADTATPLKGDEPAVRPGLYVQLAPLAASPHSAATCVECHEDAARLPHAPSLNRSTCATSCHAQASQAYSRSAHKQALDRGDANVPTCVSCHGGHEILRVSNRQAAQHPLNSLFLCGDCHKKHGPNTAVKDSASWVSSYLESAHGKAVTKSGLLWAATCADCHGAHGVLPSKDPDSSVNRANIPTTCGRCHAGVVEKYSTSIHGKQLAEQNTKAAVCTDCHTAHQITRVSGAGFLTDVINECGQCHDSPDHNGDRMGTYYQSYQRSYHGQVTKLGARRAARCSDCHGSHEIRALSDPLSRVSKANLINTCGQAGCHPNANANFVKFDPHADHRDAKNYPVLHGVWLYFMIMMSAVFTFFGLHTLLWFARSMIERSRLGAPPAHPHAATVLRRFTTVNRVNHALVAITFFGLTATGIPLVFSQQPWARGLADLFGGVEAAGIWHRFFAILLILNFVIHFIALGQAFVNRSSTVSWHRWIFGPNSLVPRWKDVTDCLGMFRWFFGMGRRPSFDRWTYWEKFDYWAEVGGSMIIGGSGLLLWFPEVSSRLLPGWSFNVAMIVHGYEALLAIGFIFTIHFFNAHIRPGTFPVDEVIFTGTLPEHELKEQRPEEYKRLVETGRLESLRVPAPAKPRRWLWVLIAIVSVGIGVALLSLIILGGLRG
jgi:cytochrome b subunit of formate dehydrogenase